MRRQLEALLFASDQPLSLARLSSFFPNLDGKAVRQIIDDLREEYDRDQHAFTIVEFGGGFSISTRPDHAAFVRKLFRGRRKIRLSKAALECLAIVAYKQPVTRLEVEDIRGVSVSGVLGTLLERDVIQIVGRAQSLGNPLLYGTTRAFLDYLGLRKLGELPQLSELEDLLAEKEELKQLAARYEHELSDDELDAVLKERGERDPDADDEMAAQEPIGGNGEVAAAEPSAGDGDEPTAAEAAHGDSPEPLPG